MKQASICLILVAFCSLHATNLFDQPRTVTSNTIIDGNYLQHTLNEPITVAPHTTLTLQNCVLNNIHTASFNNDETSTIILKNTTIILSNDIIWKAGRLIIQDCSHLTGNYTWQHNSGSPLIINHASTLLLSDNITFYYTPSLFSNTQLIMTDASSILACNNAHLRCGNTGLMLTKGAIFIAGNCTCAPDSQNPEAGISFGSGITSNDDISFVVGSPDARLKIITPHFYDKKGKKNYLKKTLEMSVEWFPFMISALGLYLLTDTPELNG